MSIARSAFAPCFRLPLDFDVGRMRRDLDALGEVDWPPERPFIMETPFGAKTLTYHDGKWKGLALRSQGGSWMRTDPGGPALEGFADTEMLDRTPYLREVLDTLGAQTRAVRLLQLPGGAQVNQHTDPYHGFKYGQLRLHVPITTDPAVEMLFEGERYHWPAGQLWYADFGRPHAVVNASEVVRVHLVIDALVTEPLLRLFPADFVDEQRRTGILHYSPPVELPVEELAAYACSFRLPAVLIQGILETDDGSVPGELSGAIRPRGTQLVVEIEGMAVFGLAPLGGHRFMLRGWTPERLVEFELSPAGGVRELRFRFRSGHNESILTLPAGQAA